MKVSSSGILPFKQTNVPTDKTKETKLFAACQELEAMVIKQMLDIMRQSVPQGGLLSGGNAEKLYQSMQDDNMASHLAKSGGLGFGEVLFQQLAKNLSSE